MNPLEYIAFIFLRALRRVHLTRLIRIGSKRNFTEYFKNFEKVGAVKEIFGEKTEEILGNLKVEFIGLFGYMGVDNADGHLLVNARYLETGDKIDIYLDVIHELCHVKQYMEGRDLFDGKFCYVDRPTEIEAYRHTVKEAKRLGLSDERIVQYLRTEWMSNDDLKKLAGYVGINYPAT
jgi:hypothetical protein